MSWLNQETDTFGESLPYNLPRKRIPNMRHTRNTHFPPVLKSTCVVKEEFEDTKGVIRIRISKKNRQHNGQKYVPMKTTHSTD